MDTKLIIVSGSKAGTTVEIGQAPVTIGRRPECTVAFASNEVIVSGNHATISPEGGTYVIRDNGSKNGTYINGERVTERELKGGELIEFGPGGPAAQFVVAPSDEVLTTLEVAPATTGANLLNTARMRAAIRHRPGTAQMNTTTVMREFMRVAYQRSTRAVKVFIVAMVAISLTVVAAVVWWARKSTDELEQALARVASSLEAERESREALVTNLESVEVRYDSLQQAVERGNEQIQRNRRFRPEAIRELSAGVALIVFSYGYVDKQTNRFLRLRVNAAGQPITEADAQGRQVPVVTLGGRGPRVENKGSATGFLVDSMGWLVTNRHVAEPWVHDPHYQMMRDNGVDVEGRFIVLRAYFPPGNQSYPLLVERTAEQEDVALMRGTLGALPHPVLALAHPDSGVQLGQEVVFIGYPTGVYNLMFRVPTKERAAIVERVGNDAVRLASALAERGLIQPLVIAGSVSDQTGTEVIHTASTTGGGSGGPLINTRMEVVAVHYAAVESPISGDPFRTQRGVRVRFVWEILPRGVGGR